MRFSPQLVTPRPLIKNDALDVRFSFGDDCYEPLVRFFHGMQGYCVGLLLTDKTHTDLFVEELIHDDMLGELPRYCGWGLRGSVPDENDQPGNEITVPIEHIETIHVY
jgi:hypothetical protein